MPKSNLPTYAIVELLMRLARHNSSIGDYKGHAISEDGVMVKTSGGTIKFTNALVIRQFEEPELITEAELARAATSFIPAK
jgi:hypothetical protein